MIPTEKPKINAALLPLPGATSVWHLAVQNLCRDNTEQPAFWWNLFYKVKWWKNVNVKTRSLLKHRLFSGCFEETFLIACCYNTNRTLLISVVDGTHLSLGRGFPQVWEKHKLSCNITVDVLYWEWNMKRWQSMNYLDSMNVDFEW